MSIVNMTLHAKLIHNGKVDNLGRLTAETAVKRLILLLRDAPRRGFSSITLHLSVQDMEPEQLNESKLLARLIEGAEQAPQGLELDDRWADPRYVEWVKLQNPRAMADAAADTVTELRAYVESRWPDAPGLKKLL